MSVARSAYRHILSLAARFPQRVEDLDDLCFALFGILLNRSDFAAAGYGSDLNTIVRNCFLRPIIPDDPRDSVSARLASSFVVLRKLHEVENSRAWQFTRERRKGMLVRQNGGLPAPSDADSVASALSETSSLTPKDEKEVQKNMEESEMVGGAVVDTPRSKAELESMRRRADRKGLDAPESATTGTKASTEDDDIVVGDATIFIERPKNHRVQKCSRHVVICREWAGIPPYSYLLPPEPMYHVNISDDFPFHLMNDAIICLAASSTLLRDQAARREGGEGATRDKAMSSPRKSPSLRAPGTAHSAVPGNPAFVARPEARWPGDALPRSHDDLYRLLRSIPTRTTIRTDFVEVEVGTQYVCSNPSAAVGADPTNGEREGGEGVPRSSSSASPSQHLFLYDVVIRVLGPSSAANPRRWHVQVMSQHLTVVDPGRGAVVEMVRPGVMGNFPMLAPGESHAFESGTSLFGRDGILRGTIQLNAFNEDGEMRALDVAMAPTRLSVSVEDRVSQKAPSSKRDVGSGSAKTETTTATR
ncbi:unnamed protein product [Phytomonas sp. EM1]|nr:unnamed protein product [Phytomonas sp. EM1]|eukprot:CCW64109.1 unnamed protein product [Phytomonas sp. isolate EM1]